MHYNAVSLKQVSCATEIIILQAGMPDIIPLEMYYLGWQESLVQLANHSTETLGFEE